MPFTPYHMGPGLAAKAVAGPRLSLMVFGFSQVAMDIEPLVHIVRGDPVLHGFVHTYIGATLVALISVVVGRLWGPRHIAWAAAAWGAFVGTYSHVFLDSIMHADMRPLAPFSNSNGLLQVVPTSTLHLACILSGVAGAFVLCAVPALRGGRSEQPRD